MNLRRIAHRSLVAALAAAVPAAALAACDAHSGPNTVALVELYTSEGCSSCPPADQELNRLSQALDPEASVIALAWHVGYWDYIGWKDPYAQVAFEQRQAWLVRTNQHDTVYTPQFFVGGSELRAWRGALRARVRQLNALPAAAEIRLRAGFAADGALALSAEARGRSTTGPAALYLALAESGLVSRVTRGENGGATLMHDHVVRAWIGPVPLSAGAARLEREIRLPPAWNPDRLELVAFVQDQRSGSVLQAVGARQCAVS